VNELSLATGYEFLCVGNYNLHLDGNEAFVEHILRKVDRLLWKDLRILRYVGGTLSLISWTIVRCYEKRFILRQKLL
jgi:hypothetical protein